MRPLNPTQDYENQVIAVKGYVPQYALDYTAEIADSEEFDEGALVSLNSDGKLEAGLASAGDYVAMPMFATQASDDLDVQHSDGNISGPGVTALVADGGFEIYTTAYDSAETYSPNTFLTAGTGDDAGLVTTAAANYNDDTIVGVVSQGTDEGEDQYGQDILYFWTKFIPAVKTT